MQMPGSTKLVLNRRTSVSTKIHGATSNMLMVRFAVSLVMSLLVVSTVILCPLMGCQGDVGALSEPCCHQSKVPSSSCPRSTIQDCSYSLIGNGKIATATVQPSIAGLHPVLPGLPISDVQSFSDTENRFPNSAGLYLRIRVLLI